MIEYKQGDIFESGCDALVNPVNSVGVAGKGLALEFRKRYPKMFSEYKEACELETIGPGNLFLHVNFAPAKQGQPRFIVSFATKDHWKAPSKLKWIVSGLDILAVWIKFYRMESIAIPAIGCGEGGLKWEEVKPLIEQYLGNLENVKVVVYEPR